MAHLPALFFRGGNGKAAAGLQYATGLRPVLAVCTYRMASNGWIFRQSMPLRKSRTPFSAKFPVQPNLARKPLEVMKMEIIRTNTKDCMKRENRTYRSFALAVAWLALVAGFGCSQENAPGGSTATSTQVSNHPQVSRAVAVIEPTSGNDVHGVVRFSQTEQGIRIVADLEGLTPGKHGFHIHEYGDCSAPDGSSAGGHFNPGHHRHGGPDDAERHAGDFGNIVADEEGKAHWERVDNHISFQGDTSILGRAVIVHADADDLTSQPSGNAGKRVACGVIGIANDQAGQP